MIHKNRKNRRHMSFREAIRKQKLAKSVFDNDCYDSLHQYSKNKPIKSANIKEEEKERKASSASQRRRMEKMKYGFSDLV